MHTVIILVEIGMLVGILFLYLRWRKRFASSEQVLSEIQGFAAWAQNNKEKMLRYTRIAEVAAGLFLLCLGYYIGKDHFHLIRDGMRAPGIIVGYKEQYFPGSDGRPSSGSDAFMPIVKFQAGQQDVEVRDWMGTSGALRNVWGTVLYDPEKPSPAMIDGPLWNWDPWAPTLGGGWFLVFVGIRGGMSRN